MSEPGKSNLLLPLGIGAGLLLLLTSMKSKAATTSSTAAAAADTPPALPDIKTSEAAAAQIDPIPAPTYAQAVLQQLPDQASAEEQEEEREQQEDAEEEDGQDGPVAIVKQTTVPSRPPSMPTEVPEDSDDQEDDEEDRQPPVRTVSPVRKAAVATRLIKAADILLQQKQRNVPGTKAASTGQPKQRNNKVIPPAAATRAAQHDIIITRNAAAATPIAPVALKAITTPGKIFPLRPGMSNNAYVRELQKRLGVPVTGNFGPQTKAALLKRYRATEVSEALYKSVIMGKAVKAVALVKAPAGKAVVRPAARKVVRPVVRKKITKRK